MSGEWMLIIEQPAPWLNANDRVHWRTRARWTKAWRHAAWHAVANRDVNPIPLRLDQVHIIAELRFRDRRRRDPANWAPTAKAIVDGLVDYGLIADDDHRHVVGPDMRIGEPVARSARCAVVLTIVELEAIA